MKLTVIVLCLLSERFFAHKITHNRFHWFSAYVQTISQRLANVAVLSSPWAILGALVLPLLLITGLLLYFFDHLLFGVIGLLLNIAIFYYCMGPSNPFYPVRATTTDEANDDEVGDYLALMNGQLFAPFFWYLVLGPLGILGYRLISLCRNQPIVSQLACTIADILDWVPARITALVYLLVGNFQVGFKHFSKQCLSAPKHNHALLIHCGLDALGTGEHEKRSFSRAENLVEHATLVLLVLLALCTLVAW